MEFVHKKYRHWKTGRCYYLILERIKNCTNNGNILNKEMCLYSDVLTGKIFVRTREEFFETVYYTKEKKLVERFKEIEC